MSASLIHPGGTVAGSSSLARPAHPILGPPRSSRQHSSTAISNCLRGISSSTPLARPLPAGAAAAAATQQRCRAAPPRPAAAPAPASAATIEDALAGPQVRYYIRPQAPWPTDVPISKIDLPAGSTSTFDLVIAGAGPSGLAVGARVAEAGYTVAIVDPQPLGIWPNNYGVWVDEFQAMGLEDCLEVVWPKAKVWLDNGEGDANLGEK
jgi:hypothetical protein